MELRTIWKTLTERWFLVAAGLAIGLMLAAASYVLTPSQYVASSTFYISAQSTEQNASSAYQGSLLSEQRIKSYVELFTSRRVAQEVRKELRLDESVDKVQSKLSATSRLDTVIISGSATDEDPLQAANIANAAGRTFLALVAELEAPESRGGQPPLVARVIEAADVPASAAGPGLFLYLVFGLLGGLVLGIVAALLREALDKRVKTVDRLEAVLAAPNIGSLPYSKDISGRPLFFADDPFSRASEAIRQIRTNLQFIDIDKTRSILFFTSALPSEGKSTTISNVALALAEAGHRTIIIDADLRRSSVAAVFGLDGTVGLTTVLSGRIRLHEAIQRIGGNRNIEVLASGPKPPNPSELLASKAMSSILTQLSVEYDFVLLDTPPLLPVADALALAPFCTGAIVACRGDSTTTDQLRKAAASLKLASTPILGSILTMTYRNRKDTESYEVYYGNRMSTDERSAYNSGLHVQAPRRDLQDDTTPAPGRKYI